MVSPNILPVGTRVCLTVEGAIAESGTPTTVDTDYGPVKLDFSTLRAEPRYPAEPQPLASLVRVLNMIYVKAYVGTGGTMWVPVNRAGGIDGGIAWEELLAMGVPEVLYVLPVPAKQK